MDRIIGRVLIPVLLLISFLGSSFVFASPVAASNIAISGTFYRQHFRLMPGEELFSPDVYVVVFNQHEDEDIEVKLTWQAPEGVQLSLDESKFLVRSGEKRKIGVGLKIAPQATPGDYVISVTAEIQGVSEGIAVKGAAQQQAKLTILGEAAQLRVETVTPKEEPFPATIKLYQKSEGQLLPCGHAEKGELEIRVAPGSYLIQAFYEGKEIAKKEFSIEAEEDRKIVLVAQTIFIYGFAVTPVYKSGTKDIVSAKITYNIDNIYQPLKNAKTTLAVGFESNLLEETELLSLPTLDVGVTGGSFNYSPPQGWQTGTYDFQMGVYSDGVLYGESPQKELRVEISEAVSLTLVAAAAGTAILIIVLIILWKRRKRD